MAKITCFGCGMMGSNIVEAFMNGGHEVFIVDVVDKNALKYIEKGAKYSKDINDALDCDFIVLSLPNDKIVLKAFENVNDISNKIVVNTSSEVPSEVISTQEYFEKLETTISDKISSAVKSFGELIFSAVLAFFLENSFDPLNAIWNKISFFQGEKYTLLKVIISCSSVFLIIWMSCRLLIWLGGKIKAFFSDNKATPGDVYILEK